MKVSTTTGLASRIRATTSFPLLTNLAFFFVLVFASISNMILKISHSSIALWMWQTDLYPSVNRGLCSRRSMTASWASKLVTARSGVPTLERAKPARMASASIPETLRRRFSPGPQIWTSSSSRKMLVTFTGVLLGITRSSIPTLTVPLSLFPITTVPISLYLSMMGIRKGPSTFRSSGSRASRTLKSDPLVYQGHTLPSTGSRMLVPCRPLMGTNVTWVLTL